MLWNPGWASKGFTISNSVTDLKRENAKLKAKNKKLAKELAAVREDEKAESSNRWRSLAVICLVIIAGVLLFLGNIFFWAGNTVVKTDRYIDTVGPLVEDPEIQKAVATYATDQIYQNIDVEPVISEALPPRAAFLAPTLTKQLESQTKNVLQKIVESPKFQQAWINTQRKTHENLINATKAADGDGKLNLNEAYQFLSAQLKSTPLSFLAGKQLPNKVGSITLVKSQYMPWFHKLVVNIDTWRNIAVGLLVISSAAAVWVSRNRRRTTISLGLMFSLLMFFTLVSMRIGRAVVSGEVDAQYQTAVQHAYQIVMHQLAIQSFTIMVAGLLVAIVAWISGPSKSAKAITSRVDTLLSGNAHSALFAKENSFTIWLGAHKRVLQWSLVAFFGILSLVTTLSLNTLFVYTLLLLISVLLVETLAAPARVAKK